MIKKWHKWFICIFAAVFISIFFVYDATFMHQGSNSSINPPINAEEDDPIIKPDDPLIPDEPETPDEPAEEIPKYTNGYKCLTDAFERFDKIEYGVWSYVATGTSMGLTQYIKGCKYLNGESFGSDVFTYCESSLGQTWYERIYSNKPNVYNYIVTTDVNSKFEYNLPDREPEQLNKEDIVKVSPDVFKIISVRPKQKIDKMIKFDKTSNKNYYIVSYVFSVDSLPKEFLESMKVSSGASALSYNNLQTTYYISKTTGQIEKYVQEEIYDMTIGIKIRVDYKFSAQMKVYKAPYQMPSHLI